MNFVKGEIDPKFKRTKTAELQQQLDVELFGLSKDSRRGLWSSMQRLKLLDMICNFYLVAFYGSNNLSKPPLGDRKRK